MAVLLPACLLPMRALGDISSAPHSTHANPVITAVRSDYNGTLQPGQAVVIDNAYGNVSIRFGGFEHRLEAHAVAQGPQASAALQFKPAATSDGSFQMGASLPDAATSAEGRRIDVSVLVPEGHAMRVRTSSGDVDVHGVHGNVVVRSDSGNIGLRGIRGAIDAATGDGEIQAWLAPAPRGAMQRLQTRTGAIQVGVDDKLDASIQMATSALFATEYSLQIVRRPGEEPNKQASTLVGADHSKLFIHSKRGQISLLRRAAFTRLGPASATAADGQDEQEDNDGD